MLEPENDKITSLLNHKNVNMCDRVFKDNRLANVSLANFGQAGYRLEVRRRGGYQSFVTILEKLVT